MCVLLARVIYELLKAWHSTGYRNLNVDGSESDSSSRAIYTGAGQLEEEEE